MTQGNEGNEAKEYLSDEGNKHFENTNTEIQEHNKLNNFETENDISKNELSERLANGNEQTDNLLTSGEMQTLHRNVENSSEIKPKRNKNELPVDRGWAWFVCLGGFIAYFNIGITNQVTVVVFGEILKKYETSYPTGSLVFMVLILVISLSSMLSANIIAPKIGDRLVIMLGGLVLASSDLGLAFSPSIAVFIFFSAVKGLGVGLAMVPSISLIRHYFHVRRSIATTISNSGQSVAVIVVGPIVMAIRSNYGIFGVYFILAAIDLHLLVAGMLMRPVESYSSRPVLQPLVRKSRNEKQNEISEDKNIETGDKKEINGETDKEEEMMQLAGSQSEIHTERKIYKVAKSPILLRQTSFQLDMEVLPLDRKDTESNREMFASHLSLASEPGTQIAQAILEEDEQEKKMSCCQRFQSSIFGLWKLRMGLIALIPGAASLWVRQYVPTIATSQGATLEESANILTVMGAVDLVNRIAVGLIADTHIVKPSQITAIASFTLGVVLQFIGLMTTFGSLIVMGIFAGICTGTRIALMALLAIEVVGLEKMPQALSFLATVGTFSVALMNPVLGIVVESTGSFIVASHIVGVLLMISAVLLTTMPLMDKLDKKKSKQYLVS